MDVKQGSPEWFAMRLGIVTASRFPDVMTKARSKGDGMSQAALKYMWALIAERLSGRPSEEINHKYLEWGKQNEADAIGAYTWAKGSVSRVAFVEHPKFPGWVGGSPDALRRDDVVAEIKCPYYTHNHLSHVIDGIPSDYAWQGQGLLWVTGRQVLDFVSYDPRVPEHLQLAIHTIERDDDMIEELETEVIRFIGQMQIKLEKILSRGDVSNG